MQNIFAITNELHMPTRARNLLTCLFAVGMALCVYIALGSSGYCESHAHVRLHVRTPTCIWCWRWGTGDILSPAHRECPCPHLGNAV